MAAAGVQTEPGNRLSRREWLRQSATALASAAAIVGLDRAVAADKPAAEDLAAGAIDAHSHIWTPDVKRYPLASGFAPADMQPASFTAQELLAQARPVRRQPRRVDSDELLRLRQQLHARRDARASRRFLGRGRDRPPREGGAATRCAS